jgi:hypothetical protein
MADSKSVQAILAIVQSPAFAANPQAFAAALVALGGVPEPLVAAPVPEPLVAAPVPEPLVAAPVPKEKVPHAWLQFSMRVQGLRRAAEGGCEKAERAKMCTLNQFAGQLWGLKHEWADEEIAAAWATFTPPAVSKKELRRQSKASTGSAAAVVVKEPAAAAEPVEHSDASSEPAATGEEKSPGLKPCKSCKHALPLSVFQKDSPHGETRVLKCCDSCRDKQNARSSERGHNERNNALARAARHQLKARAAAGDPDALAVVAAAQKGGALFGAPYDALARAARHQLKARAAAGDPEALAVVAAARAAAAPSRLAALRQKNAALLAVRKAPKRVDLALDPWSHAGTEYYKNERGDVLNQDGEWVGFWNGSAIAAVPEPADFDTLALRE